jgi:hypothetical protein
MRELYQGLTTAFAKLCASDEESRAMKRRG